MILVKPEIKYASQIKNYKNTFLERNETLAGCGKLMNCETATEWIKSTKDIENPDTCPSNWTPTTAFLAIDDETDTLVGIIDFRHNINHPILSSWGGHIGYSVLPEFRRKGYGSKMLSLLLDECREFGLNKVMIACDDNNEGSRKIIEANGGEYECNVVVSEDRQVKKYWISL
ncbi:MAG: hypothetical protein ATN35_10635 [Epulopiscium sp. Nele67-Bin004]|nr:MAG: hypothetical protein ATN35_10635 [Epulopiscium sp. Nele67-Bin004]